MTAPRGTAAYRRIFWHCNVCDAQNSVVDGECQFCDCEGLECQRDNCSDPAHFHADHLNEPNGLVPECYLCRPLLAEGAK